MLLMFVLQVIEITLEDNGDRGIGRSIFVEKFVSVNVSNVNDTMSIISTQSNFSVEHGYSIPINTLQVIDKDLNKTSDELLIVNINITSISSNTLSLYYLNGIHFTNIIFDRINKYTELLFLSTITNLNNALKYLYFHSDEQFCGMETIYIDIQATNEHAMQNVTVNVTCQ